MTKCQMGSMIFVAISGYHLLDSRISLHETGGSLTSYFDMVPALVVSLAGMLTWLVFIRHRLSWSTMAWGFALSFVWVAIDRLAIPFETSSSGNVSFDLPFGSQTSSLVLLTLGVAMLSYRIYQGRRGFDRIFTLAFGICILTTSILFHYVMFEHVGRQWMHDVLEVSETPLAASSEKMDELCESVLLLCSKKPMVDAQGLSDTGTLFMFRSRDRVVLEGASSLYPLTEAFHHGQANYMAAYHIKDGNLIELRDNIHPGIINQVMYLGLDLLSFCVAFVWIAGAFYLISFHRKKLHGRRRLSAL